VTFTLLFAIGAGVLVVAVRFGDRRRMVRTGAVPHFITPEVRAPSTVIHCPSRVVRAWALTIRLCRVGAGRAAESGSACARERADAVRARPAVEAWIGP
jgi:hypothetical protein